MSASLWTKKKCNSKTSYPRCLAERLFFGFHQLRSGWLPENRKGLGSDGCFLSRNNSRKKKIQNLIQTNTPFPVTLKTPNWMKYTKCITYRFLPGTNLPLLSAPRSCSETVNVAQFDWSHHPSKSATSRHCKSQEDIKRGISWKRNPHGNVKKNA
jgi:hypothetical protein